MDNFVLSYFARADTDERTVEKVTKANAAAFRRAGHFIDVLTIWGPLEEEWAKRRKYAMFKAGDILKALKAGVEPTRGNPNEPAPVQNQTFPPPVSNEGINQPPAYNPSGLMPPPVIGQ